MTTTAQRVRSAFPSNGELLHGSRMETVSMAGPKSRPYRPPSDLPLAELKIGLQGPEDGDEPRVEHNRRVDVLIEEFESTGKLKPVDVLTVSGAELVADRSLRRNALLVALQTAYSLAVDASQVCQTLCKSWVARRDQLLSDFGKLEATTLKQIEKLYGSEPAARQRGRLAETPAIKASREQQEVARRAAGELVKMSARCAERSEDILRELTQYVEFLRQ